jgi:hypothetical protein
LNFIESALLGKDRSLSCEWQDFEWRFDIKERMTCNAEWYLLFFFVFALTITFISWHSVDRFSLEAELSAAVDSIQIWKPLSSTRFNISFIRVALFTLWLFFVVAELLTSFFASAERIFDLRFFWCFSWLFRLWFSYWFGTLL